MGASATAVDMLGSELQKQLCVDGHSAEDIRRVQRCEHSNAGKRLQLFYSYATRQHNGTAAPMHKMSLGTLVATTEDDKPKKKRSL